MKLELFHTITIIECNANQLYLLLKEKNIDFVATPTNQNYLMFQMKCTSTKLFELGFELGKNTLEFDADGYIDDVMI
jgi:hypothetical protein